MKSGTSFVAHEVAQHNEGTEVPHCKDNLMPLTSVCQTFLRENLTQLPQTLPSKPNISWD